MKHDENSHSPGQARMPIRLSDDYLTARAANPRTGLISPSAAGTPRTPDSPGQALRVNMLNVQIPEPADYEFKSQTTRKLCGIGSKSAQSVMWLRDGSSWLQDTRALKMASPIMTGSNESTDLLDASSHPGFSEDQFVVKMPSAREPQPYKFPGSSGAQIKAFEHYKHKAKRSSVEGYDQRLIDLYRTEPIDVTSSERPAVRYSPTANRQETRHQSPPQMSSHTAHRAPQFSLPKQRSRVVHNDPSAFESVTDRSMSTHTTVRNPSTETTATTIHHPVQQEADSNERVSTDVPVHGARCTSNESVTSTATVITARETPNLGQLPRVRLIHPSLAGRPTPQSGSTARICSLGCTRHVDGNTCVGSKREPTPTMDPSLREILQETLQPKAERSESPSMVQFVESIALAFTILWQVLQSGIASHEQALHRLFPHDLTLWEKLMIVKSLALLVVKATAIFLIVAVMWKVADVAIQLLRFLLLPLRFLMGVNR